MTAETISSFGVYPNDLYQFRAVAIQAGAFTPSFWIQPISTTGTIQVLNSRTSSDGSGGWWDVNLALLPTGWTPITATTPGVTVHYAFTSTGASNDGLYLRALSTVSFNLWGAQINTGTLPAGYQVTTAAAVVSPESVTLSLPDPAHTHSTGFRT
jgi:hypothetical protein